MRVPFRIGGIEVGSVAREHLACLAPHAELVAVADDGVTWLPGGDPRDAAFARLHQQFREQGLIRAWRDETYAVVETRPRCVCWRASSAPPRASGAR